MITAATDYPTLADFGHDPWWLVLIKAVAVFGFRYDTKFLESIGEPWAGLKQAELTLAAQAKEQGITASELRRRKQELYDTWLRVQVAGSAATKDSNDPHTAAQAAVKP